jgi:GNAT superfamily N-acetyltransferase
VSAVGLILKLLGECDRSFADEELQGCASRNPFGNHRIHYVVLLDGIAVAFLAFDDIRDLGHLVLYEIFVISAYRRRGIGTELLERAKDVARELKYETLVVLPSPLSDDMNLPMLLEWYSKHGFVPSPTQEDLLETAVSNI